MSRGPIRRVFISYRREETAAYAGRLYDKLSDRFGESEVFMDTDSIEPGADFAEAIKNAVGSCDVLLVLIGRQWLNLTDPRGQRRIDNPNDFVYLEIETALQRNIRAIPILIDGATMPGQGNLPPALQSLARRQAFEIGHRQFRNESTYLIEILERSDGKGTSTHHPASTATVEPESAARTTFASKDELTGKTILPDEIQLQTDDELPVETESSDRSEAPSGQTLDETKSPQKAADWRLISVDKKKFSRRFLVSRVEKHEIQYVIDVIHIKWKTTPELLKVNGQIISRNDAPGFRNEWPFSLDDGGEIVPAMVYSKPSDWQQIKELRLEIEGRIIHQE